MICTDFRGLASPIVIRYNPTCESTRGSVVVNVIPLSVSMHNLHPKKWNLLCWLTLLFWLAMLIQSNFSSFAYRIPEELVETLPDGKRIAKQDYDVLTGWPFPYIRILYTAGTSEPLIEYSKTWLLFNLFLCSLTLFGIVLTCQLWFPKYSLTTVLLAISLISAILGIGRIIVTSDSVGLVLAFIGLLYFSPLVTGFAAVIHKLILTPQKREITMQ